MRATACISELPHGDDLLDELAALLEVHPAGEEVPYLGYIDGVLAGLLLLPELVPQEKWLPLMGAGTEVRFADPGDGERFVDLLLQRKSEIAAQLLHGGMMFEPFYGIDEEGDSLWRIWLYGCLAAIGLRAKSWRTVLESKDEDLATAAMGLALLSTTLPGVAEALPVEVDIGRIEALAILAPYLIPYVVETIYRRRHGLPRSRLSNDLAMLTDFLDFEEDYFAESRLPKVGRNQPCPCGSGKKYKKCCG